MRGDLEAGTRTTLPLLLSAGLVMAIGAAAGRLAAADSPPDHPDADRFMVVDCLLPGQIRNLGSRMTYLSRRRPVRTTVSDCEIRGGEYVAFDRANYATALKVWLPMAQEGDPEAQTHVGEIYEKGLGIQADYAVAAAWYRKAAEQGYSRAQINLGYLYESGLGVERDLAEAMNWYRRASGLTEGDLEFVSSVEAADRRAAQVEREQLRAQVESLRAEIQRSKAALATQQGALAEAQGELEVLRARAASAQAGTAQAESLQEDLLSREARLQAQRREIASLQETITRLEAERTRYDRVNRDPVAAVPVGPTIEIIDPPLAATRGTPSIKLRSAVDQVEIIGRVSAPQDLLTFKVNDQPQDLAQNGLFTARVPVTGAQTPVNVVAIDRSGQRSAVDFLVLPEPGARPAGQPAAADPRVPRGVRFGRYHALVIGNNNYRHLPRLETARNDARAVAELLRRHYGFETTLLLDADRYTILSNLIALKDRLGEQDNLLIYYAGHGELDSTGTQGHWLPIDAEPDSAENWLSNVDVTDLLSIFPVKHILVVADSCYAGTLTRSTVARLQPGLEGDKRRKWYEVMAETRVRAVLSSGGVKPVLDAGGGGHSVFAGAFLEVLQDNDGLLEGFNLFREVQGRVSRRAQAFRVEQDPQYAPLKFAGHEGGEFFFVPAGAATGELRKPTGDRLLAALPPAP